MRHCALVACVVALSACAARLPQRPSGPETPDPTAIEAFTQATKQCAALQRLTAELRLSGHAGEERLRGTLHIGLETPASIHVTAVPPFGQPFFILGGRDNRATLLLPREDRVLRDAPVDAVLERLTGLALTATDLRLILTGCLSVPANPANGRAYAKGWRAVTLSSGIVAYLKTVAGTSAVVAADHGQWRVDYADHLNNWPRQVRIRSISGEIDLTAAVGQLEINTEIESRAFQIVVPASAAPMTLDHLKSVTPLRATP
jgi:outer membrane biogenesis lipoprotein LolB